MRTLFIVEPQLTSLVFAPAKHSSRQGERKTVVSPRGYLSQRDSCQGLDRGRRQLAGLSFAQTQLTAAVLAPCEQLAI